MQFRNNIHDWLNCIPIIWIEKLSFLFFCFASTPFWTTGGKHSLDCTLILTEGDSAKSLAVSGLGVIGRDRYGVFPLRGKILNVREASHKQVSSLVNSF